MESLAQAIGISVAELTQLLVLGGVLLVGLFLLRAALKLTATLFRLGCLGILFIVAAIYAFRLFG